MSLKNKIKKIHFIGIGGAGMCGLADILIEMGHMVSGSDREFSETTDYLSKRGAQVFLGHSAENVADIDLVVYSSAISRDNSEMQMALHKGIACIRRAEILGQLMMKKKGIAVAGTHGKTTTTSLISKMLIDAGMDPTVVVGGKMRNLNTNARLGKGHLFVAEADEYDRSFLTLHPEISVITSLEEDHLDIYKDLTDLNGTFLKFANQTAFDGLSVLCADDINLMQLKDKINHPVITYSASTNADLKAENINYNKGSTHFDVVLNSQMVGKVNFELPGVYNINNALAAIAVGLELEIPFVTISKSLTGFRGVQRRFEFKADVKNILFYDDYAHHPSEVSACLTAAKSAWDNRIVVVFQPHLFSRTKDFYKEFADALAIADNIILAEIYPAREKPIAGVTSAMISAHIQKEYNTRVNYVSQNKKLVSVILDEIQAGDLCITMGAGDIWKYGEQAISQLKSN